ncbi:hypothetical protein LTR24_009527 [Lithohypha guttulata]|uniref:Uncharacterized protein n=1 Tax=Lithohypha guttulata TaxID=1690604 RepID=A0ABR0JX51_9EURO|nr:hypothetical protein LTR24_009527 [Lithohypha guttulata]
MAMPDVKAIEHLLLDHCWHKVNLKPLTEQQIALCLRKDGRLLLMDDEQFDLWTRDDALRTRLDDMATGRGQQVRGDTQRERSEESITKSKIEELHTIAMPKMVDFFQQMMQMDPVMAGMMGENVQNFAQNVGKQMPEVEGSTRGPRKNHEQKIGEPLPQNADKAETSTVKVEDSETADQNSLTDGPMLNLKQVWEGIKEQYPTMSDEEVSNMVRGWQQAWQQQAPDAVTSNASRYSKKDQTAEANQSEKSENKKVEASDRHKVLPPCYCISCSKYFWDRFDDGFPELLDLDLAVSRVQTWVENTMIKSQIIAQALARHEKALHRRWTKKNPSQRRQILTKASPLLMTYKGLEVLLGEHGPGQKQSRLTKPSRQSLLTSILILDELIEDPDLLFEHLHDRTQHPSQHFLADFMRVESAALYKDSLEHPYIFGAFQITNDSEYGKWREWEDGPIHQFEAVAAPYSVLVFESQSSILDVLSEVVSQLLEGLPASAGQEQKLVTNQSSMGSQMVRLPSLGDISSLYTRSPQPRLSLEAAGQIAYLEASQSLNIMKSLRADNVTFTQRLKSCRARRKATRVLTPGTSQSALIASLILAVPHDRVIIWTTILGQVRSLQEASRSKQDYLMGRHQEFIHKFKTLLATLFQRFHQLAYLVGVFCNDPVTPELLVPDGFLNGRWEVRSWLREYFFGPPTQPIRIMALRYLQVRFEQQQEDVRFMNDLIKEWIDEVLVVRRMLEILQACEPTVRQYFLEPFDGPRSMWYNVCPSLSLGHYEDRMEERGAELEHVLHPTAEYMLPTGRRDATWHAKQASAQKVLRDTWSRYGEVTVGYWERQKFKPSWLDAVKETMTATEPKAAPITPLANSEPRSPSKKEVTSPPMTPTSIPHQCIPEGVSERKLTRKKRDELNPPAEDEDETSSSGKAVEVLVMQQAALTITEIPIKESHLEVVVSLFSNAQQHVKSVRWNKFLNFMSDAGCEVKSSEGAGHTFSSKNVVTGARATVVLHRPHPDATLKAVHLRNNKSTIVEAFGWRKEMFVVRK